jgi:PAS domain S-box-containing protein
VISVNRAFEALSGRSRDDLIGAPNHRFLTPAAYREAAERQVHAREQKLLSWRHEIELVHGDGTAVAVEAHYRFLHGATVSRA